MNKKQLRTAIQKADDIGKLKLCQTHKDMLRVVCDNDAAWIEFTGVFHEEDEYYDFDDYFGWHDGVFNLFKVLGINAEAC